MAELTVPVREMVDLIVDQWNRGLEAREALRLLLPLTYRVLNAEAPASITEPVAEGPNGTQANPFIPGDSFFTAHGEEWYEWWVDQSGRPFAPTHPSKPVVQAWHGDDTTELRADDAKPAPQTVVNRALSSSELAQNQWAATQALASGRIGVEDVGAVVKGLHDASVYRVKPEVSGE